MAHTETRTIQANVAWQERADQAVAVFQDLADEAGWPYKRHRLILAKVPNPVWRGLDELTGEVTIDPTKHEPESIAHELAHGMHEKMRLMAKYAHRLADKAPGDRNAEQFAQMIRFAVQRRMHQSWRPEPGHDDYFINRFNGDWSRFRAWLNEDYTFIVRTPGTCGGKARIDEHRIRVQDIATMHEKDGMSADEVCYHYPSISLSQVHAALAYYYEHYEEIENEIIEDERFVEEFKRQHEKRVS